MTIRHEINEQEMINIFDQFAGSIIDGYPCEELTEYLHGSVRELAVDQSAVIAKGDFTYILDDFINSFTFDDENGSYTFAYKDGHLDMCIQGSARVINTDKNVRLEAYKKMWKLVHGKARRNEKMSQFKTCELVDGVYGLIRVTENMGLSHADYNNIVRMMDLAVELAWPSKKAPSASDLRREKLSNIKICTAIARSADEYNSIWAKLNDDLYLGGAHVQKFGFLTLRQIWKAYYRASRLSLKGRCHQHDLKIVERILRQKYDSIFPNEAIHISNCVLDIHFPKSSRTHGRKFMNKVDPSIALFDEDLPF